MEDIKRQLEEIENNATNFSIIHSMLFILQQAYNYDNGGFPAETYDFVVGLQELLSIYQKELDQNIFKAIQTIA